jgi:DNA-binding winged helix-turn-helix (wHTH) protein/tetratricopeptide (TPR) repeat protein
MSTEPKVLYEFGPFRVDPEKQLLLREDLPVAISPKVFETLLILIRHSREVVCKEDLMKALWPDAFVEEANLSQNIFMLRKALGDTPEDRRYIVTLPGRGYRFAEQVRTVTQDGDDVVIASRSRAQMMVEQAGTASRETLSAPPGSLGRRESWKYVVPIGSVVALAAVLVLGAVFFRSRQRPVELGEKNSVLIADFVNTTGDPVFDGTLRQGLAVQLEQSPALSVLSDDRIEQALRLMGLPADARLTPEIARQICERTASAAVLQGSMANIGSQYVLGLRATRCRTGEVLAEEQTQSAKKEDVLNALSQIAIKFRTQVGESLTTLEKYDTPLAEATTPSLEALKAYSTAWKVNGPKGAEAAVPFFKQAIEIDPKFAMAYASLGLMYGTTGEPALATENIRKAYELRERASDNERFFIAAYYDGRATGNQEKAQKTCEAWAQAYPHNFIPHAMLSGFIYPASGRYQQAAEEAEKAIQLGPDMAIGYLNLGFSYIYRDRPADSEKAIQRASERNVEDPFLSVLRFDVAFLKDDRAEMERQLTLAQGKSGTADWISDRGAFVLANSGHLREARKMSRQAVDFSVEAGHRERAALFETRAALREAFLGNSAEAKQRAVAALELARNREVQYGTAVALALSGDSTQALILVNDLDRTFPEDTAVRFNYMPTVGALVTLNRGESSRATDLLQTAVPNELGQPRSAVNGYFGALYPIYVRGEAYLAGRQGAEAAMEFQKILDHRGAVIGDLIGTLARLQLGRAYVLSGDKTRAKIAYRDFLTLWKDADPDIPIFRQAKAEYAKLN